MRDANCVFCKIVAGQLPCWKVYEDQRVLAFLDIGPLSEGHTLIIPKDHYVTLDQMPTELAAQCMAVVSKLSRPVVEAAGRDAWNVLQNNGRVSGQAVDHVHFHIIPRSAGDGLGYRWPAGELAENDAMRLQAEITRRLS